MAESSSPSAHPGYVGHHINNAKNNQEMIGEPDNIIFLKPTEHYETHSNGKYKIPTSGNTINRRELIKEAEQQATQTEQKAAPTGQ